MIDETFLIDMEENSRIANLLLQNDSRPVLEVGKLNKEGLNYEVSVSKSQLGDYYLSACFFRGAVFMFPQKNHFIPTSLDSLDNSIKRYVCGLFSYFPPNDLCVISVYVKKVKDVVWELLDGISKEGYKKDSLENIFIEEWE